MLTCGNKIVVFLSCQAKVRNVGKNKTGDARTIALRRIFATTVVVEKQ
jgi:hypothetical protein